MKAVTLGYDGPIELPLLSSLLNQAVIEFGNEHKKSST